VLVGIGQFHFSQIIEGKTMCLLMK
jgi:hypothetical protein